MSNVSSIFKECVQVIRRGELIVREGRSDKEFHFQNWFKGRLEALGLNFDSPGRNAYPDFRLKSIDLFASQQKQLQEQLKSAVSGHNPITAMAEMTETNLETWKKCRKVSSNPP